MVAKTKYDRCQLQIKSMDNLKLQITPIEITYNSKESLPLSCLIKKVAITTGHNLEKQQIKSSNQSIPGRTNFTQAATFTMSKEFELSNTKLSLHFMSKKDRNISCIGSAELDLATIPNQPLTVYELKLDNCNDPKARLKLEIQRKEKVPDMRKAKERIEEMGSLQTEGLQKEAYLQGRKANPNVPSAYEISRRNYKQPVVTRQEDHSSSKYSSKGKNILNQKQLNTTLSHADRSSNSKSSINSKKNSESPMPRQKTPEPIKINPVKNHDKGVNNQQASRHSIEGISKLSTIQPARTDSKIFEENIEKPQELKIKPYQKDSEVILNNQKTSNMSNISTEQKNKYQPLTDKLQIAHNKILTNNSKINNQQEPSQKSSPQSYPHENIKDYESSHFDSRPNILHDFHTLSIQQNKRQSQLCSATFNFCQVPQKEAPLDTRVILQSSKSSLEQASTKPSKPEQSRSYKPPASSMTAHSQQTSPYSQKSNLQDSKVQANIEKLLKFQIEQMQKQNKELILENQQYEAELNHSRYEANELRGEISNFNRKLVEKDNQINRLNKELLESKSNLSQKQSLLTKISNDYDHKFQQLEEMKEEMDRLKQQLKYSLASQTLQRASLLSVEGERQSKRDQLSDELAQTKKMLLDVETQLRMRDNEIRHLRLDIDNFKRQKKDLEQQIDVLSRNNKQEFVRQRSIARINQITNSSITHNTKRQNQALKTQIKLLQEKLQSLNSLFQSLISPNQPQPQPPRSTPNIEQIRYEQRNKCLEQKVKLLQQELKSKKSLMAQMINIIWKSGDAQIMDDIDHLMED